MESQFIRPLNDLEVDKVQRFLSLLYDRKLYHEEKDRLFWKGDKKGVYTVKANVALLVDNSRRTTPRNMLWNNHMPPKVCFFAWEAWWGKVLTMMHLKKRGFQIASRCPLCGEADEELNHLLIHCPSVWRLWEGFISIPSYSWVCPYSVQDLFLGWSIFPIRKRARKL